MPRSRVETQQLTATTPTAEPNDFTIDGYQLIAPIANGGSGRVYLAAAPDGERIAIKLLDPTYANDPAITSSFLAEYAIASSAKHPGLLDIRAAARTSCTNLPYLVMELLDGETLQMLIDRVDLPLGAIVAIASQVADAVAALHAAGYVHCDIKPSNIYVLYDTVAGTPRVKVIDFGVARHVDAPIDVEMISGTPTCMAPEQWRSAPQPKSDVYALGCMLYELVTGEPLFSGTLPQLAIAHCEAMPPRPSARCPGVDPRLERLIVRALAKDPSMRPTMSDMAAELGRIVPIVDIDVAIETLAMEALVEASA
nr:serine/threonine-protein kinase [Kofleriaceae bacterium]